MTIDTNFQTPTEVCNYMATMIPHQSVVYEPSPGLGNLVKAIEFKGHKCIAETDFFLREDKRHDCIVMNPPFSSKSGYMVNAPAELNVKGMRLGYYFLTECMKMSDNVIALVPWFTISDSDVRMRMIKDFGLISVTPLPRKTFEYARIQTVVLQMQKGYQGETKFITDFFFKQDISKEQLKAELI